MAADPVSSDARLEIRVCFEVNGQLNQNTNALGHVSLSVRKCDPGLAPHQLDRFFKLDEKDLPKVVAKFRY
jgi:hypothetical protein